MPEKIKKPKTEKPAAPLTERQLKNISQEHAENLFPLGIQVTITKDGAKANGMLTHLPSKLPSGWWVCGVHGHGAVRCELVTPLKEVRS